MVWTTPPLLSGYIATGSVRGVVVQLINILISVACYAPFVRLYERRSLDEFGSTMDELVGILKKCEETIAKLEQRDQEITEALSDPSIGTDLGKLRALSDEQEDVQGKLSALYAAWELLSENSD